MRTPNGRFASLALILVGCHLLSHRSGAMKRTAHVLLFFAVCHLIEAQEVNILSELPFTELLAQKKFLECGNLSEGLPAALALMREEDTPEKEIRFKELRKHPERKTFHEEDYDDEKGHMKKKKGDKLNDILNTSIMVLSYLAFGGYLMCMIASALREKRRRIMMAYPTAAGSVVNNQLAHVLQHYMTHKPVKPVIRFPAVTVHHGGKKRRRRSTQRAPREEAKEALIDIIKILNH